MAKATTRAARGKRQKTNGLWIIGGVTAAAVLVLALVLINLNAIGKSPTPPALLTTGRTLGSADAPVAIDLYSDFQCPICRRAEQTLRQLAPTYIDTGKVKVTYHNFAFIGPESEAAAQAAECANDQGKFWDYAYLLFDHQTGENVGAFSTANLKQFASDANLDLAAFNGCFDSHKYAPLINQEKGAAQALGIHATPTFAINGRLVEGLLPTAQFTALLDSMLPKP